MEAKGKPGMGAQAKPGADAWIGNGPATDEDDVQKRRALNMAWAAAGDYQLALDPWGPLLDEDGQPDLYANTATGLIARWYGMGSGPGQVGKVRAAWAGDYRAKQLDKLCWLAFEEAAFELERADRPVLAELHADFLDRLQPQTRAVAYRLAGSGDKEGRPASERDEQDCAGEPGWDGQPTSEPGGRPDQPSGRCGEPDLSPEAVEKRLRAAAADLLGFDGKVVAAPDMRLHLGVSMLTLITRRKTEKTGEARLILPGMSAEGSLVAGQGKDGRRGPLGALLDRRDKRRRDDNLAYVAGCFGQPLLRPDELTRLETAACLGPHQGRHLWVCDGVADLGVGSGVEFTRMRLAALEQRDRNQSYYERHRHSIETVARKLARELGDRLHGRHHLDEHRQRAGRLDARRAWRCDRLDDGRVFARRVPLSRLDLSVDLLLDASGSRSDDAPRIATQAAIVAAGLAACGIRVRVLAFCSVRDYTVLRVFGGRDAGGTQAGGLAAPSHGPSSPASASATASQWARSLMGYTAAGMNRDGLALRAAGLLPLGTLGPGRLGPLTGSRGAAGTEADDRRLIIFFTDGAPLDDAPLADRQAALHGGPGQAGREDRESRRDRKGRERQRGQGDPGYREDQEGQRDLGGRAPASRGYVGRQAVDDLAETVRQLRSRGIHVAGVFDGEDQREEVARRVFGHAYVRIRAIERMAPAVAALVADELRELDS